MFYYSNELEWFDTLMNLKPIFENLSKSSSIKLSTLTNVKLKGGKKNEMQGRVTKRSEVVGNITNQTIGNRVWGKRFKQTPIIEHNGNFYLELVVKRSHSTYFLDGIVIKKFMIDGLPPSVINRRSTLSKKLDLRTYKSESILLVEYNGLILT